MLRIVNNWITMAQRAQCTDGDLFLCQTQQRHHGDEIFVVTVNMAVGTGGAGGGQLPPQYFANQIKIKSLKITTHKSVYSNIANKDKIGF